MQFLMLTGTPPTHPTISDLSEPPRQRVDGSASVCFQLNAKGATKLKNLHQRGSAKIRLPKSYSDYAEAVLINTAGGLTGGDRLKWSVELEAGCKAIASTQACEKAYRATSGHAEITTKIQLGEETELHWLPQETILYENSSLKRSFDISLKSTSRLLALESVMLGRQAMDETLQECLFHDRWRARKNDKLIYADDAKLDGKIADIQNGRALMGGHRAFASLLYIGPEDDETLGSLIAKIDCSADGCMAGFSAFNGKISGRILAPDTYLLRQQIERILRILRDCDLPRVWRI